MTSYINLFIENDIKPQSAKTYNCNLSKLIKLCNIDVNDINNSIDNIVNTLNNNDDILVNSKINYLVAFRKFCDIKNIKLDSRITDLLKKLNEKNSYKEPTKKELQNKINLDYIIKYQNIYKNKRTDKYTVYDLYYLLCSLYIHILPLRSSDYYETLIHDGINQIDTEKNNYYDIHKKQLVLNTGKNIKNIGQRIIDINDELHDIIIETHNKSNSQYLLCSRRFVKLNDVTFTTTCNRCFKKKVSSSMIRKCILSDKIDKGMSANERKQASYIMGHSMTTQQLTYSRFSDVLHPDDNNFEYLMRRSQQLEDQLKDVYNKMLNFRK